MNQTLTFAIEAVAGHPAGGGEQAGGARGDRGAQDGGPVGARGLRCRPAVEVRASDPRIQQTVDGLFSAVRRATIAGKDAFGAFFDY